MHTKSCPICDHQAHHYCAKGRTVYYKCKSCSTIFQNPLPTLQEMMDYANTEYKNGLYKQYLNANDLKYATFEYRFEKVLELFGRPKRSEVSPRILDVGTSNGRFIEVALKKGIDAWGLELSENAIAAAPPEIRNRIYYGDANALDDLEMGKFNIVTAFDLVEHLFDPIGFLTNLSKIITKDGIVVITTPDAGSILRIIMGKNWSMLQPYQHTILLSRKASKILLQKANYSQVSICGTKKFFTLDYLFSQLQGPNPTIYRAYTGTKKVLPRFVREIKVQVNIGEMMVAGSRL